MARMRMVAVLLGAASAVVSAEEGYRHGRILSVEPGVTLQRASEPGAEEAFPNLPFLPGDRIWTDRAGRAEFQFADGTILRVDGGSKLDYVAHEDGAGADRVILRLWSGGLYLHNRDTRGYPDFGIETPGGVVEARVRGVYRVDAVAGETRLSVYEGEAALEAEREVLVRAGERAYARRGQPTEDPQPFDRAAADDFDRWDADREDRQAYAGTRRGYLPEPVLPYAAELESSGAWYYESEIGHVWRPYVASGWRPYFHGRWVWTAFGYTWVPNEPWGWAPFHYGRWGYAPLLGWYWIPGNSWGPGWVTWATGGDYVGWCPLGYRDRPVVFGGRGGNRGRAVPRSPVSAAGESWAYVRRGDIVAPDLARKIETALPVGHEVRTLGHAHSRPTRDFVAVEGGMAAPPPRNVKTRPGPGDTVPELRTDPATTIPFPTARRRHREGESEEAGPAAREAAPAHTSRPRPAQSIRAVAPPEAAAETAAPVHPTDARARHVPRPSASSSREGGEAHPARTDADREVLRRVFGPLSQPRPVEGGERPAAHPRPAPASERPAARERPSGAGAVPRHVSPRAESRPAPAPRAESQRTAPSGESHATTRQRKENEH